VEVQIAKLITMPLLDMGRAGNLVWVHFGVERQIVSELTGKTKSVGDYALHIQCPWRLMKDSKVRVGYSDLGQPASSPELDGREQDGVVDLSEHTAIDEAIPMIRQDLAQTRILVSHVQMSDVGDLRFVLTDQWELSVFVATGRASEQWRLFQPGQDVLHLVQTGSRLDWE
jgi:hypothetical protein